MVGRTRVALATKFAAAPWDYCVFWARLLPNTSSAQPIQRRDGHREAPAPDDHPAHPSVFHDLSRKLLSSSPTHPSVRRRLKPTPILDRPREPRDHRPRSNEVSRSVRDGLSAAAHRDTFREVDHGGGARAGQEVELAEVG